MDHLRRASAPARSSRPRTIDVRRSNVTSNAEAHRVDDHRARDPPAPASRPIRQHHIRRPVGRRPVTNPEQLDDEPAERHRPALPLHVLHRAPGPGRSRSSPHATRAWSSTRLIRTRRPGARNPATTRSTSSGSSSPAIPRSRTRAHTTPCSWISWSTADPRVPELRPALVPRGADDRHRRRVRRLTDDHRLIQHQADPRRRNRASRFFVRVLNCIRSPSSNVIDSSPCA